MLNLRNFIGSLTLVLSLASCSKDESYAPFHASAIHNGVLISYIDANGQDMFLSEDVTSSISIKGQYSKKDIPFAIKKIAEGNILRGYLSFNAELPDSRDMVFNDNKTEAYGTSLVSLCIHGKQMELICRFVYNCSNSETYGSNIIKLECVECNGISMSEKINSQIKVELSDLIGNSE